MNYRHLACTPCLEHHTYSIYIYINECNTSSSFQVIQTFIWKIKFLRKRPKTNSKKHKWNKTH